jgi:hypothetical protein
MIKPKHGNLGEGFISANILLSNVKDPYTSPENLLIADDLFQKLSEEAKDVLSLILNTPSEFIDVFFNSEGRFRRHMFVRFFRAVLRMKLSKKRQGNIRRKYPNAQEVLDRVFEEISEYVRQM